MNRITEHDVDDDDNDESLDIALALEASHASLRQDRQRKESEHLATLLLQQEEVAMANDDYDDDDEYLAIAVEQSRQDALRQKKKQQQQQQHRMDEDLAKALEQSEKEALQHHTNKIMNENAIEQTIDRKEGSWDCLKCTFTNPPYEPYCQACATKAPKYILTFIPLPRNIRFGVEIEIIMSQGKKDGFTLKSIAKNLTTMGPEKVKFLGYSHETTRSWKIVTDSSIQENERNEDLCFELVSPVLIGDEGLQSLRSMMNNIRSFGISSNSSCGFHVHVDAERQSILGNLEALKRVSQCFVSLENAFDLVVAHSWDSRHSSHHRRANRGRFCQSNRLAFGEKSNKQRWNEIDQVTTKQQLVHLLNPNGDRYRKLNLTNIIKPDRPSTCEFRHHGRLESTQEAEAWVRFILLFCQNAARKNLSSSCLLPEGSIPKVEVRTLFDLIHCQGLQQLFMVERRLFQDYRFRNEWSCRVCRKRFRDSRSLSQHQSACNH